MARQNNLPHEAIKSLRIPSPEKVHKTKPWSDDWLGTRPYAENLTEHINISQAKRSVMSIHGEWGSGKTFMLRRWRQQLENDGYIAVYINAWQDDFQDPLVAIIGQLKRQIPSNIDVQGKMSEILKNAGTIIASNLLEKHIGIKIGELLESGQDIMKRYEQEREALDKLNAALYQLAPKPQGKNQPAKSIVFIIDELDRCRPDYSIKMLERIKHLFEPPTNHKKRSPGIRFVLGINRNQLEYLIRRLYGSNMDVENYLRKLLDVELIMRPASPKRYFQCLLEDNQINGIISEKIGKAPIECISAWIDYMQFSLRQVEHFLRTLCGAWNAIDTNKLVNRYRDYEYALFFLIALRIKDHDQYQQYRAGGIKAKALIEYFFQFMPPLELDETLSEEPYLTYMHMEHAIYGLTQTQDEIPHVRSALESLKNESIDVPMTDEQMEEAVKYLANTTIECNRAKSVNRINGRICDILDTMNKFGYDLGYLFRLIDTFANEKT